jgi:Phosphotransferase system mannitol/fructose-specific IIA domain (Ntr-type)
MQEALGALVKTVDLPEGLDREALLDALLAREDLASTAIGNGIAIPHVRRFGSESLQHDIVVVAYLFAPVDWKALDGIPVHTLFLVLAKDEASHLQLLAEIAHVASDESFVAFLKTMPDRAALVERIQKIEQLD